MYSTLETSDFGGEPFFLYEFTEAITESVTRFTSGPEDRVYTGDSGEPFSSTFTASSVAHTEVHLTSAVEKQRVDFTFPTSNTFARSFVDGSFRNVTTVTLWRAMEQDPNDVVAYWKGRIMGSRVEGERIVLSAESAYSSLRVAGLRARYQRTCRHVLYGSGCRLDYTDFDFATTVATITGARTLTLASVNGQANDYFTGGLLIIAGSLFFIEAQTGVALTVSTRLPDDLEVSDAVSIAPGCDRSRPTCEDKFDNVVNFGGFPYMPGKNPFQLSSIV